MITGYYLDKALGKSVEHGKLDNVKHLIEEEADINTLNSYPLYASVVRRDIIITNFLIENGADPLLIN